ncbi:MAG TPA: hypothetical protein P5205_13625 [Candidatus Paceibacterota bacterium]|nr:hypothetical protein [Verrucomicrobiota bacterium]HSA11402.1 hypothetical protein [Candidatus Paceibacterota bacterium]
MKHGEKMVIGTLAGLAFCLAANAVTSDSPGNPYLSIVERNVFALKPPAPPPDPEANKPPPSKILLQGITTFGGVKRVLFKMAPPAKPGEKPAGDQSYVLAEGQRDGDIEILEINPDARTVKVNNSGTITDLNFEENGIKAPAGPAPGAAPTPPGFVPSPGANPVAPAGGASPFNRPVRLPTTANTMTVPTPAAAAPSSMGATPTYFSPAGGAPAYGGRTANLAVGGLSVPLTGSGAAQSQTQTQPGTRSTSTIPPEQRAALIEAYREKMRQQGVTWPPEVPPLPQ